MALCEHLTSSGASDWFCGKSDFYLWGEPSDVVGKGGQGCVTHSGEPWAARKGQFAQILLFVSGREGAWLRISRAACSERHQV